MLWKHSLLLIICSSIANCSIAQLKDSTRSFNLPAIEISDSEIRQTIGRMNEVEDFKILAGKKNEVIWIKNSDADLSINNARQIFSKVPGVNIWENDGSGIQTRFCVHDNTGGAGNVYDYGAQAFIKKQQQGQLDNFIQALNTVDGI